MSSNPHRIRPPTAADRSAWEPLWQAYLRFYESSLPAEVTETLWQRILDPAQPIQCRVAAADGELAGLVHFFPHPHTWYAHPVCYLNDLFVAPALRGGGVGERLIRAVYDEAAARRWSEVYWLTRHDNTAARGLYDKLTGGSDGFVSYSLRLET